MSHYLYPVSKQWMVYHYSEQTTNFLSNSFACEYSEPDPYYPPDTFSLQPSPLELPEDEPTQCPQRPFLSSAVPFSSELQLDHISSSSADTARNSDVFRGTLDDLPIDMHSDTQDLAHDVFNYLESKGISKART